MSEPEGPLEPIGKRDFKQVTATKNRIVKAIKSSQSDEAVIELLTRELPKALDEYASILFEAAGIDSKIEQEENYRFLKNIDFEAIIESDRILGTVVKEVKFLSLLEEMKKSAEDSASKVEKLLISSKSTPTNNSEKLESSLARVEKVR